MPKWIIGLAHAAVICVLGLSPAWAQQQTRDEAVSRAADRSANSAAFALVDHTGRAVTDRDFLGAYMLVFFGYTHCPDVCPTDLMVVGEAMDLLGAAADKVQPVFVTIDPARDTVAVMADFVGHFHPRLVGLTGTGEQIAAVTKRYRVRWRKFFIVEDESGGVEPAAEDEYLLDHTAAIYLIGPDGGGLSLFHHGTPAEDIADVVRQFIEAGS